MRYMTTTFTDYLREMVKRMNLLSRKFPVLTKHPYTNVQSTRYATNIYRVTELIMTILTN